ncbi:hypothetical protein PVAND_005139 [Polypedilum vanderplanki]|uniref:MGAT4 conserved region domain-containing protein n=1 Tax=Polypedilum vanderplanki TaxID=319348 RepID=A0A9J6BZH1_POLVA|nr:hypothetical protein PVAND_005139 [Polypedilum vanderplanki]
MVIKVFPALLRRRGCLFFTAAIILVPFTIFVLIIGPDLRIEQNLSQKLAECQVRLQYLEAMYRTKQEDVSILSQYLGLTAANSNTSDNNSALSNFNNVLESLSPESKAIIKNLTMSSQQRFSSSSALRLPTAYHFLPHLLDDPASSLKPAFLQSKGRTGVSIVLGIPTVRRDKQSYLLSTLDNLIANMDDEEANDTMIVVFIGETNLEYVTEIAKQIQLRFQEYCENGLIEIISPPASYYPDWNKLRVTLNDPVERVKWRSKQNLDFAFLMAYSQIKGTFYVQLEDDILSKRGYITIMKRFAVAKTAKQDQDPCISNTLLDHIVLNSENNNWHEAKVITSSTSNLSDHSALMALLYGKNNSNVRVKTRIIKNDYNGIFNDLTEARENIMHDVVSGEIDFNKFINITQNIINKHKTVLTIKHKKNENLPPYVDARIAKMMRNIDNIHEKILKRKKRKMPINLLLKRMNLIKTKLNEYERNKAKNHYASRILCDRNATWKIINSMCGREKKENKIILRTEDGITNDDKMIANILNEHFAISNNNFLEFIPVGRNINFNMNVENVDEEKIKTLLKGLAINKSTGADGIPARIWREMGNYSPTIAILVNRIIDEGVYPQILKIARIKPLFKGGDPTLVKNYRPISILPALNKIVEKYKNVNLTGEHIKIQE